MYGRAMACEECGKEIPGTTVTYGSWSYERAPRYDAKFCGAACKQRAYRKRKKEEKRRAVLSEELPGQLGITLPATRATTRSRRRAPQA